MTCVTLSSFTKVYTLKFYRRNPSKLTNTQCKAINNKSDRNKLLPNWQQNLNKFGYLDYGLKIYLSITIRYKSRNSSSS